MKKAAVFLSGILIVGIGVTILTGSLSYAQSVDELTRERKNVESSMENAKKEVKKIENQIDGISDDIENIDLETVNISEDIVDIEKELETLTISIEKTESELVEMDSDLRDNSDLFEERIRRMYINGNLSYLEVILSSSDIRDFLSRQNMVKAIAEQDRELIRDLKEQIDEIEMKKDEINNQKVAVEKAQGDLKRRKDSLIAQSRQKEVLMDRLSEDVVAYEKEYDRLNDLAKSIEREILKKQSVNTTYSGGQLKWPVPGHSRISSPYGNRIHPIFKVKKLHTGIDIPAPTGSNIIAVNSGKVIHAGWLGGYGNVVMLDHGGGIVTLYAHNSAIVVNPGQKVLRGDTVAKAGSTGNSTGPHLHFEVRKDGAYVDPMPWLK